MMSVFMKCPLQWLPFSSCSSSSFPLLISCRAHLHSGVEDLTTKQKGQASLFIDTLLHWNQMLWQRMNLTSVRDRDTAMERHVQDSLALLPIIETSYMKYTGLSTTENLKVVDVGSGAGLPGFVLAIARPSWKVTLIESMQKRCDFMQEAKRISELHNVEVIRARAEEAGHDADYREAFDVGVARAVAEMRVLVELCLPLVRVGGILVAAKGPDPQEEVELAKNAALLLGATILPIFTVASEGVHGQRTAVVCLKKQATSTRFPRKPGKPSKEPL